MVRLKIESTWMYISKKATACIPRILSILDCAMCISITELVGRVMHSADGFEVFLAFEICERQLRKGLFKNDIGTCLLIISNIINVSGKNGCASLTQE